jgi:hypothetical protein
MIRAVQDLEPGTVVLVPGESIPSTVLAVEARRRFVTLDRQVDVRTARTRRTILTASTTAWEVLKESPADVSTPPAS